MSETRSSRPLRRQRDRARGYNPDDMSHSLDRRLSPSTATPVPETLRLYAAKANVEIGTEIFDAPLPARRSLWAREFTNATLWMGWKTEMDVDLRDIQGTQEERFRRQAEVWATAMQAALDSGVCRSFMVVGNGDKFSWLEDPNVGFPQSVSPNAGPSMFDDDFNPKTAYYAMLDVLKQHATR